MQRLLRHKINYSCLKGDLKRKFHIILILFFRFKKNMIINVCDYDLESPYKYIGKLYKIN